MKKILTMLFTLFVTVTLNAQGTFEGEIVQHGITSYSKLMKKVMGAGTENGASDVNYIIKGNKMLQYDKASLVKYYYSADDDEAVAYSEVLKRGIRMSYKSLADMGAVLSKESTVQGVNRQYNIKPTGQTETFLGQECAVYKGTIIDPPLSKLDSEQKMEYEAWIADKFKMPDVYNRVANSSFETPGLVMKSVMHQTGSIMLVGRYDTYVYLQIKSITPRTVEDNEVSPSADWEIKDSGKIKKFLKEHYKYLKEHGIDDKKPLPEAKDNYDINEEWDF